MSERINQREANAMILYLLCAVAAQCIGVKILQMMMGDVPGYLTSRMMEGIGLVLLFVFCRFTPFRIYRTGFFASRAEIRRTLIRCGCICIGIILCFVIARLVMSHYDERIKSRPWFYPYFSIHMRWLYPFTAVLQEFFAKGVIQENLKRLFGKEHTTLAIFACALTFSVFHIGYSLYFMLGAALLSFVTGFIYEKDRSIWGCVMIHFCLGFLPRAMGLKG